MKLLSFISFLALFLLWATPVSAQTSSEVTNFTRDSLNTLTIIAALGAVFFLIKGGYGYITSSGKPDSLDHAKLTIRNALIGLVLVLSASFISQLLTSAFTMPSSPGSSAPLALSSIVPQEPPDGLTQVILDAMNGFMQNVVQSATKPLVDGVIGFLTTTPSVLTNSVIFNFWLIILGITDSLFVLIIALLGLHFMSASTFGFEEIEFKHLLPRIALAFLGANVSIFLVDWIIASCNALVRGLISITGGLDHAWVLNSVDLLKFATKEAQVITLIFFVLFVLLAALLLLFYIIRLITISVAAVLSPLIFLLWALPKFSDFAEVSVKTFIATVYSVFVHIVIIQLASAFLAVPEQAGTNSIISILIAIGLFITLLKTPNFMVQLMFYNTGRTIVRKIGGQIMNTIAGKKDTENNDKNPQQSDRKVRAERKTVLI